MMNENFRARRTIRNGNSRRISLKYDWNVKFRHKAKNNGSLSELLDASTSLVDENKREFIVDVSFSIIYISLNR